MNQEYIGRIANLPNASYHISPGISKSGLDKIAQSPMHYKEYIRAKLAGESEDSKALRVGSAVHSLILEPEKEDFIRVKSRLTKEGKAIIEANPDKLILSDDEYLLVDAIADSVGCHPFASKILEADGETETSFYWQHELGMLCKCRPDYLRFDGLIVDIKTTEDASPEGFARSSEKYRYYVQTAFYRQGIEAVTGMKVEGFVFIAVEKSPPYAVACYLADQDMIAAGDYEVNRCLNIYKNCLEKDEWPGYPQELIPLSRPRWAA